MTSSPVRIQTSSLFILDDVVKFNIWDVASAMSSDEIGSLGLFMAGLQPLQASLA